MSNLIQVADELKAFANKFKGIVDVAEALDKIGNFDQSANEAMGRKVQAEKLEKDAQAQLGVAVGELQKAHDNLNQVKTECAMHVAKANEKAAEIHKAAQEANHAINAQGEKLMSIAKDDVKKSQADKAKLLTEIGEIKTELDGLKAHLAEHKAKLNAFLKG